MYLDCSIELSLLRMSNSIFLIFLLIVFKVEDALSSIVFSSIIEENILSSICLFKYNWLKYNSKFGKASSVLPKLELKYSFNSREILRIFAKSNNSLVDNIPLDSNFFIV